MKISLLIAFLLASALKAQSTTIKPGPRFCGDRAIPEIAFIDVSATHEADDAEAAFVARWLDPRPGSCRVYTSVFTRAHCVASNGAEVDGKIIDRILGDFLSVSKGGFVVYEANYWDSHSEQSSGKQPRRGVFIEQRFVFELDPTKLHWDSDALKRIDILPDFVVTDEGRVIPNPEVMMLTPLAPSAKQ